MSVVLNVENKGVCELLVLNSTSCPRSKHSLSCFKHYFLSWVNYFLLMLQLTQAQTGKFNVHVHVEYEWRLQNEDLDESEDEMEDKVCGSSSGEVDGP